LVVVDINMMRVSIPFHLRIIFFSFGSLGPFKFQNI
jgi:hypothetical protein